MSLITPFWAVDTLLISARYYGHNGDDCVSVVNGATDIVAKNGYCGFASHGLSIGSLGRNGAEHRVKNVLFKNWTMEGAVYGARVRLPPLSMESTLN